MRRDTDRVAPLLGQCGIVDNQPGIFTADLSVGFGKQRHFQRRGVPDTTCNEMVQLVVADVASACRHRLNALAITRADQPGDIGRTHPTPRLVP